MSCPLRGLQGSGVAAGATGTCVRKPEHPAAASDSARCLTTPSDPVRTWRSQDSSPRGRLSVRALGSVGQAAGLRDPCAWGRDWRRLGPGSPRRPACCFRALRSPSARGAAFSGPCIRLATRRGRRSPWGQRGVPRTRSPFTAGTLGHLRPWAAPVLDSQPPCPDLCALVPGCAQPLPTAARRDCEPRASL